MGSGGAQTHIFELARGLMKRGHRVVLVSSGGHLARQLAKFGARCYCLEVDARRPLSVFAAAVGLYALIKREAPDIVHAHTRAFGALCRALGLCRPSGSPVYVSTVHAHFDRRGAIRSLRWYSSASIAVSEDLKQYLLDVSRGALLPERIEVIPNGIDTDRFVPINKSGGRFRICFMSRLDADCSHTAHLLCALADRIDRLCGAEICIIGGGSELCSIRSLASEANRRLGRAAVRAVGELDAPERVIARSDLFIGVSRAALEAMSCGVPVILSGNEGFGGFICTDPELERAAAANFCCRGQAVADADSLMSSIREAYLLDAVGRSAVGERLRAFVMENNSLSAMIEKSESFYEKELTHRRGSTGGGLLLCGYYGFDNLGDNALLSGAIKRAGRKAVAVLARHPRRTAYKFGARCASRTNPIAVAREIEKCRALIFGGGSLLQSCTSFRSLCWYSALLIYAKRRGKRTELWANGLGGFRGRLSERLAARALRCTDKIGLRDGGSELCAHRLIGKSEKTVRESDLSMLCDSASRQRISFLLSGLGISQEEKYAVIAPKGVRPLALFRPAYRRALARDIRELCRRIREFTRGGVRVIIVPMHSDRDGALARMLCRHYGACLLEGIGAEDLLGVISGACAVVSMRYHALLFALRCGVPATAIGDDPKLRTDEK